MQLMPSVSQKPKARPLVKWAGGKTQFLGEIRKMMPAEVRRYYEPFVGGGAVFFDLQPHWARLNDLNEDLVNVYRCVRDVPSLVVKSLGLMAEMYASLGSNYYYEIREMGRGPDHALAARFIFLNKTCFNGLHRVNKAGRFNVPEGKFKTPPTICDEANLRAVSDVLQGVVLTHGDFEDVCETAAEGDFVYFDPPYDPASATSDFTAYTKEGLSLHDQRRLSSLAWRLKCNGVHVLLSAADTPTTRKLYCKGFDILRVEARRNINSKGGKRGAVGELLIT